MNKTFGLVGGDQRQTELGRLLAADGNTVFTYGPGGDGHRALLAETVILPLPLCGGDGVLNCPESPMTTAELFDRLRPQQRLLAGQVKPRQRREAAERGLVLEDYFLREEVTVANAAATAEAALQVAMEHLDRTLLGMPCLVLGFGRIGKLLGLRLRGLGAQVTASARKAADLAWARAMGCRALALEELPGSPGDFGAVFNTIPSPVLDRGLLSRLPPECLLVDLASVQGIDPAAARELGLDHVWARSLPGRMTPRTAAEILRSAVYAILSEERGDGA